MREFLLETIAFFARHASARRSGHGHPKSQSHDFEIFYFIDFKKNINYDRIRIGIGERYYGGVERVIRIDRAYLVAAAAAREFNDELTVIVNSLEGILENLEDGHPALPLLSELQGAAQRCAWKTAGMLEFTSRRGVPLSIAPLEKLLA